MRRLSFLHKVGPVSTVSSVLAPIIDNRFVPYPYIMIMVVTRRCNSRCQMCSIWKEKDSPFLSLEQIEQIYRRNDWSFVRSLTLTGGEPTLRADLPELFGIALRHTPSLEHLLLATSGLNTHRTIEQVRRMLEILDAQSNQVSRFDVQISLDGIGEVHDTVRGISGFFQQVEGTLAGLRTVQDRFPRLNLRLSCVLMPYNVPHVDALHDFAKQQNLQIHYSPVVLRGEYYNNLHGVSNLAFTSDHPETVAAQKFFERLGQEDESSLRFYYRDMAQMVLGQPRHRRCMMGFYGFVLEHDGNVYPCVNCEHNSFGNLLNESFENVWFANRANDARRELRASCCPTCTSMCFVQPVDVLEVAETSWLKWRKRVERILGRHQKT